MILADIAEPATRLIEEAGKHGGLIWVFSLVIVSITAVAVLIIYKVTIPNGKTFREVTHKLSDVQKAMAPVLSETHQNAQATRNNTDALVSLAELGIGALKKINARDDLDISEEIFKIEGLLHRHQKSDDSK